MNLGSYWFSDKIVLALYKAKEISREANPKLHLMVEELAQKANIPKPKLYLVSLPIPNAFAAKEKLEIVSGAAPPPLRIFAGGFFRQNAFGLIQEYCTTEKYSFH